MQISLIWGRWLSCAQLQKPTKGHTVQLDELKKVDLPVSSQVIYNIEINPMINKPDSFCGKSMDFMDTG